MFLLLCVCALAPWTNKLRARPHARAAADKNSLLVLYTTKQNKKNKKTDNEELHAIIKAAAAEFAARNISTKPTTVPFQ